MKLCLFFATVVCLLYDKAIANNERRQKSNTNEHLEIFLKWYQQQMRWETYVVECKKFCNENGCSNTTYSEDMEAIAEEHYTSILDK